MGYSTLTPPIPGDDPLQTDLEFADNRLLAELCGEYDRNLVKLEHELDVQIVRRGNRLHVMGDPTMRSRATQTLQALYDRLSDGKAVESGDVEGALHLSRGARPNNSWKCSAPVRSRSAPARNRSRRAPGRSRIMRVRFSTRR